MPSKINIPGKYILTFIIAIISFFVIKTLLVNEEQEVKNTLSSICEYASFSKPLHPIEKLQRAKKIGTFLTESITFKIKNRRGEDKRIIGKDKLIKHIVLAHSYFQNIKFSYTDATVEINGKEAKLHATATGKGLQNGQTEKFYEAQEIIVSFTKDSGDWLATAIENVEMLEK